MRRDLPGSSYGMSGRIFSIQLHPWECPTKYSFLVLLRCNVDVQDMRRVLPPSMWMTPDDKLEPPAKDCGDNPYPQRVLQYSAGEQSSWGWFQHLNTTPDKKFVLSATLDWHAIWTRLLVPVKDAGVHDEFPPSRPLWRELSRRPPTDGISHCRHASRVACVYGCCECRVLH